MTSSENVIAAKAIRAELRRLATKDQRLTDATISVRATHASMMSDVTVRITGYADGQPPARHDTAAQALSRDLWAIVNRHWDHDGRIYFADVYVNGVSF
jgi:hypothetical protein